VSFCSYKIPEHINACFPSWHEIKKPVAVNIGLSDSHPFTNISFQFPIIVKNSELRQMT